MPQNNHARIPTESLGDLKGSIGRTIVHNDHLLHARLQKSAPEDPANGLLLVERWNDDGQCAAV
jgi:hypothetical protein